ncbi:MAG: hypothetical protein N4A37_10920 [Prolixibacteraceae bacterium]|nr:hypothetical protein [Prolixibacteraceae bacterium]
MVPPSKSAKSMDKPWTNHGRTMDEPWRNHGATMEQPWTNPVSNHHRITVIYITKISFEQSNEQ